MLPEKFLRKKYFYSRLYTSYRISVVVCEICKHYKVKVSTLLTIIKRERFEEIIRSLCVRCGSTISLDKWNVLWPYSTPSLLSQDSPRKSQVPEKAITPHNTCEIWIFL